MRKIEIKKGVIRVALFGIHGYVGMELRTLLEKHPVFALVALFTRKENVQEMHNSAVHAIPKGEKMPDAIDNVHICFLATPPDISLRLAPCLYKLGKVVIDLSPAFRLPAGDSLQNEAVYGLSPWWTEKNDVHTAGLVAVPGCYVTCALMSILPLLQQGIIDPDSLIIDAKSGASGAGRSARKELLFCEIDNNFIPYKVGKHQHLSEMRHYVTQYTGKDAAITFVAQMLPLIRGIAMTIYAQSLLPAREEKAIAHAYATAYRNYSLVTVASLKETDALLALRRVMHSPKTHITYHVEDKQIIIFSCIDNLLKGAASQAVEVANTLSDLPLTTGLDI